MRNIYSKITLSVCASLLCLACNNNGNSSHIVDVKHFESQEISSIAKSLKEIPLKENITVLGNIMTIKGYKSGFIMYDEGLRKIINYSLDGNQIAVLDKIGRAMDEYTDIGTYSICETSGTLFIFERSKKQLKKYDSSTMRYIGDLEIGCYINALEVVSESEAIVVKEKDNNGPAGISALNLTDGTMTELLPLREDQADLMMDTCFSWTASGNVRICVPGYPNRLYEYSKGALREVEAFVLDPTALSEKYWEGPFNDSKEELMMSAIENDGDSALIPVFVNKSGRMSSIWYVTCEEQYMHNLPSMRLAFDGAVSGCYAVTCAEGGGNIAPVGVTRKGDYISIVSSEELGPDGCSLLLYSF